jgi:hypothetical protein
LVRPVREQTLAAQDTQGLTQRHPAHSQQGGHAFLPDLLPGKEVATHDEASEPIKHD